MRNNRPCAKAKGKSVTIGVMIGLSISTVFQALTDTTGLE